MPHKRQAEDDARDSQKMPRKSRKKKSSLPTQGTWAFSQAVGGRMLGIDPLFSHDGRYVAVAFDQSIKVFSTATSLPVRTLDVRKGSVTGLAHASSNRPDEILVSMSVGRLDKWNWYTGAQVNVYDLGRHVEAIAPVANLEEDDLDVIFTIENDKHADVSKLAKRSGKHQISAHTLSKAGENNQARVLRTSSSALKNLWTSKSGRVLVVSSEDRLLIGTANGSAATIATGASVFTWHELATPDRITCLDVRVDEEAKLTDGDIAIGTASGAIYVYLNVLSNFRAIKKNKERGKPATRKLHWHRFPVKSLKYSRDGLYLISGGFETVLCIWQLDTGKRQDIPHLTAPIRNTTVSHDGAAYAMLLDNNSFVILSTLDYKATFNFSAPTLPPTTYGQPRNFDAPAVIRPGALPEQLLFATPSALHASSARYNTAAVYLQTVDVRTGTQLQRQALTRTNVTDKVSDPQGHLIVEPSIQYMAVSASGGWLATIESWQSPSHDQSLPNSEVSQDGSSAPQSEVFLKFWQRNDDQSTWELSSRIDNPHGTEALMDNTTLDLVHISSGFATLGHNGQVKIWREKYRQRDNLRMKNQAGSDATVWYCASILSGPPTPIVEGMRDDLRAGKLAASTDGSLLAVALQYDSSSTICLIDVRKGEIIMAKSDLTIRCLHAVAFLDQFLIVLSENLLVWDIVEDRLHYSYGLRSASLPERMLLGFSHLAVQSSGTFAVAVPDGSGSKTQVAIFEPNSASPVALHQIQQPITNMFPSSSSNGYVLVDGQSQIHHLAPPSIIDSLTRSLEEQSGVLSTEIPINGLPLRFLKGAEEHSDDEMETDTDTTSNRPEIAIPDSGLAEIFAGFGATGRGDVKSMFEKMAEVFIGR